jgi:hypothetical protein
VKVPYSRMSQTIQSINRMGGKVAGISLGNTGTTSAPVAAASTGAEAEPQAEPKRRSGGRKNRSRK